jgi:hypothetical protein
VDAQIVAEQCPLTQLPVQHSAPEVQIAGGALQAAVAVDAPGVSQRLWALQTPLQQLVVARLHAEPRGVQGDPIPKAPSWRPPSPPPAGTWLEQSQP